jgi:hypothetical protein
MRQTTKKRISETNTTKQMKKKQRNIPTSPVDPQQAKHMACVKADLPVPFGPNTIFNRGPVKNSHSSNVRKFLTLTLTIDPTLNPRFNKTSGSSAICNDKRFNL